MDFSHAAASSGMLRAARLHLMNVIQNNSETYALIKELFNSRGHYHRTIGNHDDIYNQETLVEDLRQIVYPDITVADFILLAEGQQTSGLIAHGHQTDAWNSGICSFLGKITTSLNSALRDISFLDWNKGVPQPDETKGYWDGQNKNELSDVSRWVGVNSDLGSLDEIELFGELRDEWGNGQGSLESGPYVILGHTHEPKVQPGDPRNYDQWRRYWNTGCGMFYHMVTGVEWDGTADPMNPQIRLVAWRYGEDTGPNREGKIVRRILNQTTSGSDVTNDTRFGINAAADFVFSP
jgi:hypothetical protein